MLFKRDIPWTLSFPPYGTVFTSLLYFLQNATIKTQSEALSSRNAQLEIEMESLRMELQITKGDYASLVSELNEARDYYHQLDLSATTMGHRCEVSVSKFSGVLWKPMNCIDNILDQNCFRC